LFALLAERWEKSPWLLRMHFPALDSTGPVCVHYIPLSALPFPLPLPLAIKPERALLTCCAISQVVEENRLVNLRYPLFTAEQKIGLPIN